MITVAEYIQENKEEIKNLEKTFAGWKITGIGEKCLKITNRNEDEFIDWGEFEENNDKFSPVGRMKKYFQPLVDEINEKEIQEKIEFIKEDEKRMDCLQKAIRGENVSKHEAFEDLRRNGFLNYAGVSQVARDIIDTIEEEAVASSSQVGKTTIQISRMVKDALNEIKKAPSETYNEVISRLIEVAITEEFGFVLTNNIFKINCKADFEEDHWYFLDELGNPSEMLEPSLSFVDEGIQKEYEEFIKSINAVAEDDLNLLDYGADLQVGEATSFDGFTMKRVY